MKICSRFIRHLMMALVLLSSATFAHAAQVTATWTGAGDGTTYTDANNWIPKVVPRNGLPAGTTYKAVIDGNNARAANVQLNSGVSLDALVIDGGDRLSINDAVRLTIINSGAGTGTIVNAGTLALNSTGGNVQLLIQGDVALSGGGTVTMADAAQGGTLLSVIFGSAATDRLTNVDNTIRGAGGIGNGQMLFTNTGTVVAQGTNRLVIQPTNSATAVNLNTGTLRAEGGTLEILIGLFTNTNGVIEALDASKVLLRAPVITGGTLKTAGSGLIQGSSTPTLNNVTNTGNYEVSPSTTTKLIGTITNRGNIRLNSSQAAGIANLRISGDVTLNGGGTVTMNDAAQSGTLLSVIFGDAADARLTNADNTISGAGGIGNGQMLFTNVGTVVAQGTNPLVIQLTRNSTGNINTGTLRGAGAGGLVVFGSNLMNTGGTLEALAGSNVDLSGSTITGGTLATAGTGIVRSGGFRGLTTATLKDVTNTGNFKVNDSASLILQGTMTNRGNIRLASSEGDNFTTLRISEEVTLNGGGTLTLDDAAQGTTLLSIIDGATANARLINADNIISGAGRMEAITLINNGTILPLGANPLLCFSNIINNGTIRVDAGSTLRFDVTAKLTQSAGLLLVNGAFDNFRGPSNLVINGGTLAGTGTISHNVANGGGLVSPGNLTGTNDSSVGTLTVNGNYAQGDDGKLFIQIAGSELTSFDHLVVNGTALFAGTLDVQLLGVYAPASVDEFKIVDYASRAGTMKLNVVGRDSRGGFTQQYNLDNLMLTAQGTPTIGVNLQPTQVFTNTVLTATILASPGAPVNSVTYDFQVNGVSKQKGSSNTYDLGVAGQGDKNDMVTVVAQTDDDRSNQNSVTVQNTKPIAQGSTDNNARGGQLISIPLAGTDLDGDALTFNIVAGARNGVAAVRAVGAGFVLDYTGRANFNGNEAIQFIALDGQGNSAPATTNIAVNSPIPPVVNRAPIAFSRVVTVDAGQATDIPLDAADPDPRDTLDTLGFLIVRDPAKGTRQNLFLRDGRVFFRYLPNVGASGADSFQFVAVDKSGNGLTSNVATISIAINGASVNRAPVASSNGGFVANAGEPIDIRLDVTDPEDKLETLIFKTVQFPIQGTLQTIFLRDQRVFIRYLPNADARGTDSFTFTATDPGGLTSNVATIAISINARNVTPIADNASATVDSGQSIDIPVTATSPVGSALTFNVINNPTKGNGSFVNIGGRTFYRYRSVARYNGSDSINFRVTDAQGRISNMATITIRVLQGNRAPVAFDASINVRRGELGTRIDIPLRGSDPDSDPISYRIVNNPTKGSGQLIITSDGRAIFRYRASGAFNASDRVTFIVTDSAGRQSSAATISINAVASASGALQVAPSAGDETPSGGSS